MIRISLTTLLLVNKTTSKFPGCAAAKSKGISLTRRRTNLPGIKSDFRSDRINMKWLFLFFITFPKPKHEKSVRNELKYVFVTSCTRLISTWRVVLNKVEQKIPQSCTLQYFSHTHTENQLRHPGQNQRWHPCGGRVEVCCVCVAVESSCVIYSRHSE